MAVYLIGFTISLVLIALTERKRPQVFLVFSVIALLIPCLIAGLRADSIGTDVNVYVKQLTQAAIIADDLPEYYNSYWFASYRNLYVQNYEIGFSFLVYVVAKLTKDLGVVLFAVQALTIIPIYIALCRNKRSFPVWLGMLVYYFLFFNTTLNMMRQWIAMAFLLLALQMMLEKKGWLTVAFCVLGFFFHYSAVLIIPVYAVYWFIWLPRQSLFVHNSLRINGSTLMTVLFFLVAVIALLNLPLVLKFLSLVGFDRFNNYLEGEDLALEINQVILRLPLFGIFIINWKDMVKNHRATPFYMAMLLFDTVASQLVSIDVTAFRIGFYFSLYSILWIPAVCSCSQSKVKRTLTAGVFIVYAILYWYYMYVHSLRHETYPYAFAPYF